MTGTAQNGTSVPATVPAAVVIPLPVFQREITVSADLIAQRDTAVAAAVAIATVTSQAEYDRAGKALADVTRLDNDIEEDRLKLCRPFAKAQKDIKAKVDEALAKLRDEKKRLKDIMGVWWVADQARIRREAAERDRLERERVEKELADRQALQEQADALGLDAPPVEDIVEQATPVEIAPRSESVRTPTMRVSFEVVAENLIPNTFCTLDPRKVNEYIRANKADIEKRVADGKADVIVAGLRFTVKPDVQGRG